MTRAVIQGIGMSVPERVVTNYDLEKVVATSHDWIVQRTGIVERRVSGENDTTSSLALAASREALSRSGIPAEELDMVVCGTVTGDMPFPSTSCIIQDAIGARYAGAMDIGAACAGFIYSLSVATAMIESGQIKTALVIGADSLTKFMDWSDRSTCVLFGDGAGAVVVRGESNTDRGVLGTVMLADGSGGKHIRIDIGGSKYPFGAPTNPPDAYTKIFMAGAEVYRFAVTSMGDACCKLLDRLGMEASQIDLFVPHQANLRIIESAAHRLHLPPEKVMINVQKYGNTSGGSIPIGLYEAEKEGRLRKGMTVMTVGFGAGLVWGANLIRW
ncbi:MAG: 3-oxoacyl-[acyl-carrier-protein] synthase 3 [Fimbriimonadaceae bacterium]|nr:3-oxoacyl-[acyl-carrier-protein] synthase 3 [Fimbriimonadaceae bacterium]